MPSVKVGTRPACVNERPREGLIGLELRQWVRVPGARLGKYGRVELNVRHLLPPGQMIDDPLPHDQR